VGYDQRKKGGSSWTQRIADGAGAEADGTTTSIHSKVTRYPQKYLPAGIGRDWRQALTFLLQTSHWGLTPVQPCSILYGRRMKKSIWIFLLAVLLPGFVLGWLALRSAEEQQIIFERRTAELYQKETESLAATAREIVETERRNFGDTDRLLARSDAEALARDFTNSLMDAWPRKAVGFVLGPEGQMLSPTTTMAAKKSEWRQFLWDNGSFLCSTQPAVVYPVPVEVGNTRFAYNKARASQNVDGKPALAVGKGGEVTILAQKGGTQQQQQQEQAPQLFLKQAVPTQEAERTDGEVQRLQKVQKETGDKDGATLVNRGLVREAKPEAKSLTAAPTPQSPAMPPSAADPSADRAKLNEADQAKRGADEKPAPSRTAAAEMRDAVAPREKTKQETDKVSVEKLGTQRADNEALQIADPRPAAKPMPRAAEPLPSPAVPMPPAPIAAPAASVGTPAAAPAPSPETASAAPLAPAASAPRGRVMRSMESQQSAGRPLTLAPKEDTAAGTAMQGRSEPLGAKPVEKALDAKGKALTLESASPADTLGLEAAKQQVEEAQRKYNETNATAAAVAGVAVGDGAQKGIMQADQYARFSDLSAAAVNQSPGQQLATIPEGSLVSNTQNQTQNSFYSRANTDLNNRMVVPQQQTRSATSNWSAILPATADFRALTANSEEGMLARFVQDKLDLIFWLRPPEAPEMVFGCLIEAEALGELWKELFANHNGEERSERPPFVLALLDDKARPVAMFPATEKGRDWKRPFVASEIGEVLPHWEAALYLATPTAMADTARGLRRTLSFTIAAAIGLIAIGGWLVVADVRRQLALAQQKTDFVSNVSHELKTPLTSIRMFAELMHDRPPPAEKQGQYLRIITVEAERLTRLINNVLDFAKLERRQKRFDKKPLDLCNVITRVWEGHEMHLRDAGFETRWEAAPGPYPVLGDEDALAQVLVNLLSNAEKYSQERKDVELVTWIENGWINVSVLDRGTGVPNGEERKIFEAFYRAHDSLNSGIQGSGLGLTLAQRLAREHGGEIVFERRKDGGSRFTLRMPMVNGHDAESPASGNIRGAA
jgi:signal transduction histidine kinase